MWSSFDIRYSAVSAVLHSSLLTPTRPYSSYSLQPSALSQPPSQLRNPCLDDVMDEVGLPVDVQLGHHVVPMDTNGINRQFQHGGV